MLRGLAPARRRLVLTVLLVTVLAIVGVGTWLVVQTSAKSSVVSVDQNRLGPVLLVPGYGGSTSSLETLAARLTAAGRDATVVALPGDGTGDLNDSATRLSGAVSAAMSRTGSASVDIVGYSAGGIITRLWVAGDGASKARRIVLLGTPNHGTTLADFGDDVSLGACPTACRQLTTTSDLLARLNAGNRIPTGPTVVSIWTTQDQTVTPPDSARLDGAINTPVQSICANMTVSHSDLPRDRVVQAMVLAELDAGPPSTLTSADCGRLSS